ncbi:eCIS core domain-containing protein [Streptomyces botrytidirepellens]|uniref:DUF4157 domain-containing protein n=1 Tax=Streptomyces botrytidirepellens TaxID=2486417 RepID=A0A3M8VQ10_9ACTN|nr:DUF4157 domain-containing protein [Streptomyces botrytidirepellens]RNG19600.1 DUF4157 domain-containing protein [Streptomyces botrytidirepellens]
MSNSQSAAQDDRAAQSAKRRKRKERTAKARTPEPKDIVSGAGQPLDASVRRELEEQLGHDFSRVRLHTDRDAGHLTEMLGADAVAVGQDIFFREGTYAPGTAEGQRLLAHELLHTVQNPYGSGPLAAGRDLGAVSLPQEAAEQEAESTARRLMRQEATAEDPRPVEVEKGEVTPAWMRYATVDADRMRAEKLDPAGLVERLVGGVLRSLRGDPADASQRVRTELARMAPELQDSVLDRLEVRLSSPEYGRLLDLVDEVEQGGPQLLPMDGALAPEAIPDTIDQVEQEREQKRSEAQAAQENKEKAKDERRKRAQRRKAEAPDRENAPDRDAGGGSRRAAGPKGSNGSGKGVGTESGERESVEGRSAREQDGKQQESEQNAEEADKQQREDQDKDEQKKKDEEKTQKENAREKEEQEKKDDQEAEGKEEKKEQEESGKKDEEEQNKEDGKDSGDREEEEREAGKKEAESTAERERDGEGDKADEENRKQSARTSGGIDRRDAEPGEKDRQGGRGKDDERAADEEDSEDDEPLGLEEDGEDEAAALDDDADKDDEQDDAGKSAWDTEIKPQDHLPEDDLDVSGVQTADRMAPGTASAGSPAAPERGGQDAARAATDSGKPAEGDRKEPGAAQGVQGKHGVPSVPKPPPTKADAVEGARAEEDAEEGANGPAEQNEANAEADKDLQSGKTADQEVGPDPEAGADKDADKEDDADGDPGDADTKQERAEDRTRDAETRRAEEDSGKESGERSEGENSKDGSSEKLAKADEDKRGQATDSGGSGKDVGEKQDGAKGTSQEGKTAEGSKDSDSSGGKSDDSSAGKDPKSTSEEKNTDDSGSKDPASSDGSSSAEKQGEKAEDDGATKEASAGKGQATEEDKAAGEESASASAAPKVSEGTGAGSGAGGGAQGGGGIPAVSQAAGKSAAPQETAPKADAPAPKEKPTPQAKKAAKAAKPAAKQSAQPVAARSAPPPKPSAPKADASKSASAKAAKGGGGPAPKAPKGGGGGGPAPLKGKKDGPAPDVSNSTPEAGLASAGKLKPHQALQTIKGVDGAVNKSVGKERAALAKAPPKMERPSGSPKTLRGGPKPAAPGQYTNEKVAKTDAAKGKTPQINGEQRPKGELPESQAEEPSWWDIGGTLLKEIIKRILPGKVADSIDSLKTTDDGLQGARVGDAPRLPTDADADPERTDKQQKKLDDKSQELQKAGREDAARPMGEDQIYPDVPKETLEAKVDGAKGGADRGAKGGGKAPGAGGPVTVEAVSAVAEHDRGPQIKRGFAQGQKQMSKERADKEKKAKEDKQRHEKNVRQEVSSNGKTQEDARNKGRSDVAGARDKWRKEQDDKTADIEGKKGKKYDKARKDIKDKKEDTDKKVDKRTEDDNKEIDNKRDNAEKEAKNKRKDDKEKSGNWISQGIDWVKEQFNKLKKAIKGIFEKARNLVTGIINEFKTKVFEFIDKARDWVVKQINDFADALIALGDELLKNYPAMRDKWRNTIDGVRDAAVKKVNEAADALKKGIGKLLDGLGKLLTAGLDLLEKGLLAAVSVAETVVTKAMEYGGALLKGLGEWAQIASDIVTDPGGWISNAKASAESGARDHLFNEVKAAVKEWFNQKVQEIIGIPLETFNTLIKGGMSKEEMAKMAWDAAVPQLPLIIGELVITKVVAKLIPGAGWVMAIIDALQTAWGALSEILRAFGTFMEYLKAVKAGGAKAAIMFAKAVAAGVVALLELVYEALISGVGKYMGKVSKSLSGIAKTMRKKKPAPRANKPRSPRKKPAPRKRPSHPEKEARPEKRPAPEKRPKPHEQRGRAKQEEKKDRREERREEGKDVNLARRRLRDANRKLRSRDGDDTPRRGVARDTLRRPDRRRREDRDTTRPGTRNDSRRPTDNRPDARRPDRDQDRDRRPDANRRDRDADRRRDDARNRPDADRRRDNDRDRPDADRRRDTDRRRETEGTKKKPRREGESRPGRALRRARQTVKSALGRARRAGRRLLGKGRDLGRKLTNNIRRMRDAYKRRRDLLKKQHQRREEQRRQQKQQKREKTRKKENSPESKTDRLRRIVARIRPRVNRMLDQRVPQGLLDAALFAMRSWYRLTSLRSEGSERFSIEAHLNPTAGVTTGIKMLGPELQRTIENALDISDPDTWNKYRGTESDAEFRSRMKSVREALEKKFGVSDPKDWKTFRTDQAKEQFKKELESLLPQKRGEGGRTVQRPDQDPDTLDEDGMLRGSNNPRHKTGRASFRKETIQKAWDNADRAVDVVPDLVRTTKRKRGEAPKSEWRVCPTRGPRCDVLIKVAPDTKNTRYKKHEKVDSKGRELPDHRKPGQKNQHVPRDWDGSHTPSWTNRQFPPDLDREGFVEAYQQGVWLECAPCNRSRQANDDLLEDETVVSI